MGETGRAADPSSFFVTTSGDAGRDGAADETHLGPRQEIGGVGFEPRPVKRGFDDERAARASSRTRAHSKSDAKDRSAIDPPWVPAAPSVREMPSLITSLWSTGIAMRFPSSSARVVLPEPGTPLTMTSRGGATTEIAYAVVIGVRA